MNDTEWLDNSTIYEKGLLSYTLYPFQVVVRPIAFLIGVPLNVAVALVLVLDKKLHNARNVIWLGVILSNLAHFFSLPLEYFIVYERSYLACQIHTVVSGKPYLILLINLVLATCDRLIYTKWPLFHARHVTVLRVVAAQLTFSTIGFVMLTFPFWALNVPIRCGFERSIMRLMLAMMIILTMLCIFVKMAVYFMAKSSNSNERNGVVTREIATPNRSRSSSVDRNERNGTRRTSRPHLLAHCGSRRAQRVEHNATMTLVAGLIPLCLFGSLSYLFILGRTMCNAFSSDNCQTFSSMEVYFRELTLLHVSTDLLVYIGRSLEFRASARAILARCTKTHN